jgi:hypothetical protein
MTGPEFVTPKVGDRLVVVCTSQNRYGKRADEPVEVVKVGRLWITVGPVDDRRHPWYVRDLRFDKMTGRAEKQESYALRTPEQHAQIEADQTAQVAALVTLKKHGVMASGLGLADGRWTVPQLLALADAVAKIRETP